MRLCGPALRCSFALVGCLSTASSLGCSASTIRRFPLQPALWTDTDLNPVSVPCRPDPKNPDHRVCTPKPYESSFAWDAADQTVFRPVSRLFAVDPAGEATNVNSLDETPDSSWFTNRIGRTPLSVQQVFEGACEHEASLDASAPDGSWVVDQGKMNGANPGFRVKFKGVKYMLKFDTSNEYERATGATAIATRFYHAAGWSVPCERVVYFRRSVLKLSAGLTITDNAGVTRPLDDEMLDKLLQDASRRGPLIRALASKWLSGRSLGPFKYDGVREDDPNDVIPHEDRRDLRGARLLAAWLNHFDSREQNTMSTWVSRDPSDPDSSPGYVRHWYMDLGDCFGSQWEWEELTRRIGHAYYFDVSYLAEDLVTLGTIERPWDRAQLSPKDGAIFGYFHSRDFNPELWRGGYPNPAFQRMVERDGAWFARIAARFLPEHLEAAVRAGDYTKPEHQKFLVQHLLLRQYAILARYFHRLSPLTDPRRDGTSTLCVTDLARRAQVYPLDRFRYGASLYRSSPLQRTPSPELRIGPDGDVCIPITHGAFDESTADDAPSRYVVVDVANGASRGPLRVHLYDLGPKRGIQIAGAERPDDPSDPR